MEKLETIFQQLKKLLKKHEKSMRVMVGPPSASKASAASKAKPSYGLLGEKEVSIIEGRRPQKTYLAGIIQQKHFVGFYFMPIYSHPKKFAIRHPEVKRFLKGKSCFNVTRVDADILAELDRLLKEGKALYKREGWI